MPTTTEQSRSTEAAAKPVAASARRKSARKAMPFILVVEESDNRPQSWRQSLRRRLTGPEGVSLCASMAVHVVLFLIVGLVLYLLGLSLEADEGQRGPINAFFTEKKTDELLDLDQLTDIEFDLPAENVRSFAEFLPSSSDDDSQFIPELALSLIGPEAAPLSSPPENSPGKAKGDFRKGRKMAGFAMPADKGRVITRGSFSVWTVPEDPRPKRSYIIVIQLNRRINIRNLKQDISGTVRGTDGYFTGIGRTKKKNSLSRQFVIPKARQIVIHIPGANKLIKDVIKVHSEQLDESQDIEIVF